MDSIVTEIIRALPATIVGVVLGSLITWRITKKLQFRPHVHQKWLSPIYDSVNEHRQTLSSLAPLDVDLLRKALSSIEFSYFPRGLRKRLPRYRDLCDKYNDGLDRIQRQFLDDFKQALIKAGVPIEQRPPFPGGAVLHPGWLVHESNPERSLDSDPSSGLIAEVIRPRSSTTLYAISPNNLIGHSITIKTLLKELRERYQTEKLWNETLKLRDKTLKLNQQIKVLLPKS